MTEAEARAALRAFVGGGELEPWITEHRWEAVPGGWRVLEPLQGWRLRLEVASRRGLRLCVGVCASGGWGEPAVWFVPARSKRASP